MEMIADILMAAGAMGAGLYCMVLSRRLSRFADLETGVGGAVALLSAQVDDLTRALAEAQGSANVSARSLEDLTTRAGTVAKRLELMLASMHDLPVPDQPSAPRAEPSNPEPMFHRHAHAGGA